MSTTNAKNTKAEKTVNIELLQKQLEKLQKENEQLKKTAKPLSFEQLAEMLQQKQRLLEHIKQFEKVISKIEAVQEVMNKKTDALEINSDDFKISFLNVGSYRNDELINITNVPFISDFIEFTKERALKRINELKNELLKY